MTSAKNLLFVDDEDSIRLTLTPILKKHGFEVTAVASVSQSVRFQARIEPPLPLVQQAEE